MGKNKKYVFLLLCVFIIAYLLSVNKKQAIFSNENEVDIKNQESYNNKDNDYFELIGYGELVLTGSNQNINLVNKENNSVYISYKVYEDETLLYETGLISPGKMEQYNAYKNLEKGTHLITYLINIYDNNNRVLWQNIKQEQKIRIE